MKTSINHAILCLAFAGSLTIGAATGTPSQAADEWSGFYVGAQGGHQWTDVDFSDPAFAPSLSGDYDLDSFIVGGHVGYNFQDGPIVVGVEADFEFLDGDGSGTGFIGGGGGPFVTGSGDHDWQGSVRARLGYVMGRFLVYGTVGVAFSEFDFDYTFPIGAGAVTDSFSETMVGITAGGGVEFAVFNGITAGAEYRYTDWGSAEGSIVNCCAGLPNVQRHEPESHAVRARVSFHFNSFLGGP